LIDQKQNIMKKLKQILLSFCAAIFLAGCASTGVTTSTHLTNVGLSNANYKILATNVQGSATTEGVFGVSLGVGLGASQWALIPLTPERTMYKIAMENLWESFEKKNGSASNRTLALVNLRYDSESLNIFLYTKLTVVVVADVVEFE